MKYRISLYERKRQRKQRLMGSVSKVKYCTYFQYTFKIIISITQLSKMNLVSVRLILIKKIINISKYISNFFNFFRQSLRR